MNAIILTDEEITLIVDAVTYLMLTHDMTEEDRKLCDTLLNAIGE